jgi:hypothetical protein
MKIRLEDIDQMIYEIRGQKVMLDSDLALLYDVETKALNRQVKRNMKRFPLDFMFQLTEDELEILRCQNGTSSSNYGGRRYQPFVFTENGVAMLSGILNSDRAIEVNISIMRIFTRLRSFLMFEKEVLDKVGELEKKTTEVFKVVFKKLDNLERIKVNDKNRKIGIKPLK